MLIVVQLLCNARTPPHSGLEPCHHATLLARVGAMIVWLRSTPARNLSRCFLPGIPRTAWSIIQCRSFALSIVWKWTTSVLAARRRTRRTSPPTPPPPQQDTAELFPAVQTSRAVHFELAANYSTALFIVCDVTDGADFGHDRHNTLIALSCLLRHHGLCFTAITHA